MKNFSLALAMAIIVATFGTGCGQAADDNGGDTAVAPEFTAALAAGLADLSVADFADVDATVSAQADPQVIVSAPAWFYLVSPVRNWQLGEVQDIVEAPGQIFSYYVTQGHTLPTCASTTPASPCSLVPNVPGGSCSVTLAFTTDCAVTFPVNGISTTLLLSGSLTRTASVTTASSGAAIWDGAWTANVSADNFKVKEPTLGRFVIFDGLISGAGNGSVAPFDWRFIWSAVSATAPTIVNYRGDSISTHGVHQLSVLAGNSIDYIINAYPSLQLAGGRVFEVHRQVQRQFKLLTATTASLQVNSTLTNTDNLETWTRTANLNLEKLSLTSVRINGNNTIGAPGGHVYGVQLTNVVVNAGSDAPVSGSASVSIDGLPSFTIYFTGQCKVNYDKIAGGAGNFNLCRPVTQ